MVSKMKCKEFDLLVDYYLRGELGEKKQEEFEEHYFKCDSCFLNLKIKEKLLNKEVIANYKEQTKFISLILKPAILVAAILLIFISILIFKNSGIKSFNTKFIEIVKKEEIPIYITIEQRNGIKEDMNFKKAVKFFENQEYKKSLNILNTINKSSAKINFLKGVCLLKLIKPEQAINEFDKIIKSMNPSYYDEALYYKGLALLIMNKKEEAKKTLTNLKTMLSPYALKADFILKKIN